jgi:antitoxin VapB
MTENTTEPEPKPPEAGLAAAIMEIGRRCAALPDFDRRSADEILGYDENGLPS